MTAPFTYPLGTVFPVKTGTMTVMEQRKTAPGEGKKGPQKEVLLRCDKGHAYWVKEGYLKYRGIATCKRCAHRPIIEVDPEFAAWFADPAVPQTKTPQSHEKADFICQGCHRVVKNKSIHTIYQRRFVPCPWCTDGRSFGERFLEAFFAELRVPVIPQYAVKLGETNGPCRYLYDFYDPTRKKILEVHGVQHFQPGAFCRLSGQTLEEIQQNDREKQQYAQEVLGLDYQVIDCRRSEAGWVEREIRKKLTDYPIEQVDWARVRREAQKGKIWELIRLRQEGCTLSQIAQRTGYNVSTVCYKLQRAVEDGLFDGEIKIPQTAAPPQRPKGRARKGQKKKEPCPPIPPKTPHERFCEKLGERGILPKPQERYQTSRTPIAFYCPDCQRVFRRMPAQLLAEGSCPLCQRHQEFLSKVEERYPHEYEVLGFYEHSETPVELLHKSCGKHFWKSPHDFLRTGCPHCGREKRAEHAAKTRARKGQERFWEALPLLRDRGYIPKGEYRGLAKPMEFFCQHCGQIWNTLPGPVLQGREHICKSPCRKKTPEDFAAQVAALTGQEYTVLTPYVSALKPVWMRHNLCGHSYPVAPAKFTSAGRRCPKCSRKRRR